MTRLIKHSQRLEIDRPLFILASQNGFPSAASMLLQVHRMDGLPERDRFGERLRQDSENWLTHRQTLALFSLMICGLPRYR